MLISFDRLQPAAVLASQPERDAGGMQIMLRRIEVNSSQLLGFRRTHRQIADKQLAAEALHIRLAQFDLELQFPLHRWSLDSKSIGNDHCHIVSAPASSLAALDNQLNGSDFIIRVARQLVELAVKENSKHLLEHARKIVHV